MKIFNISNAQRFFETVLACEGNVYRISDGGMRQDLKRSAEYLLSSGMVNLVHGIDQMELCVEQTSDARKLMRLMTDMRSNEAGNAPALPLRRTLRKSCAAMAK